MSKQRDSDVAAHFYDVCPSGHMTLIQRRLNVDATSWRCIDVEPTLYKRHVPAGSVLAGSSAFVFLMAVRVLFGGFV